MSDYGDRAEDSTINVFFTTHDGDGGAVAPSSGFEAADVAIFKDGSDTEKTSTNGLTMTSPFNATTGLHRLTIDTSNDTGDGGFWVTGSDYTVALTPDETVDSQSVVRVIAEFSIENRPDVVLQKILKGDWVISDPGGGAAYQLTVYKAGTATVLVPAKNLRQLDTSDVTSASHIVAGAVKP